MARPSGDQNGRFAPSVPGNSLGVGESSERSHKLCFPPWNFATSANTRPSGEMAGAPKTGDTISNSCGNVMLKVIAPSSRAPGRRKYIAAAPNATDNKPKAAGMSQRLAAPGATTARCAPVTLDPEIASKANAKSRAD